MNSTPEEWRDVVGFPDYEVSSHGRVRSKTRQIINRGRVQTVQSKILKPSMTTSTSGKPMARLAKLRRGGQSFSRGVHRLVLEAFVGPAPAGLEGCHDDGNPDHNWLSNLRWDTHAANHADSVRHGTFKPPAVRRGAEAPWAKLSEATARHIIEAPQRPGVVMALARELGMDFRQVSRIRKGDRWGHLLNG